PVLDDVSDRVALLAPRGKARHRCIPDYFARPQCPHFAQPDTLPLAHLAPSNDLVASSLSSNQLATTNAQIVSNLGKGLQRNAYKLLSLVRSVANDSNHHQSDGTTLPRLGSGVRIPSPAPVLR